MTPAQHDSAMVDTTGRRTPSELECGSRRRPATSRAIQRAFASARCGIRRRLVSDRGSMMILTTGLLVVILMVCALGVSITGVHLARNELQARADGAALAASQGLNPASMYVDGESVVDSPSAKERAREYLREYPPSSTRLDGVDVRSIAIDPDGGVRVTLGARVHPPLIGWFTRRSGMTIPLHADGFGRSG